MKASYLTQARSRIHRAHLQNKGISRGVFILFISGKQVLEQHGDDNRTHVCLPSLVVVNATTVTQSAFYSLNAAPNSSSSVRQHSSLTSCGCLTTSFVAELATLSQTDLIHLQQLKGQEVKAVIPQCQHYLYEQKRVDLGHYLQGRA